MFLGEQPSKTEWLHSPIHFITQYGNEERLNQIYM